MNARERFDDLENRADKDLMLLAERYGIELLTRKLVPIAHLSFKETVEEATRLHVPFEKLLIEYCDQGVWLCYNVSLDMDNAKDRRELCLKILTHERISAHPIGQSHGQSNGQTRNLKDKGI